jgi:hypothetical protein
MDNVARVGKIFSKRLAVRRGARGLKKRKERRKVKKRGPLDNFIRRITRGGSRPRDASRRELGINPPAFVFPVHNDPRGRDRSRLTGFGDKTMQTNEDLKF